MLEIEIVEVNIIDGGVEVFARAWQDGQQIGFGLDGTVDIERFRIINPPALVDDPNGDIVDVSETYIEATGETITNTRTLREDLVEATLQAVSETISVMKNVHGDENIIPEKRGNTTTTVYSNSGGDGAITSGATASFATVRAGFNLSRNSTATQGNVYVDTAINIRRLYLPFDTSSIPSGDTVSAATLTVTHPNVNQLNGGLSIGLTGSNQASLTALNTSDWTISDDTRYSTDIPTSSFGAANTTYDYAFNASGIAAIAKGSGFTKLTLRIDKDIDNVAAGVTGNYADIYFANESGTTRDPKLVVEHAAATTRRVFNIS